jgi:hypothetical protein
MAEIVFYEIGVGLGGLFSSIFFLTVLNQNSNWQWRNIAYKFTAGLTFFSISILTQVLGRTWNVIQFAGIRFPPLNVLFEAIVLGFMISGLWDIWTEELEDE